MQNQRRMLWIYDWHVREINTLILLQSLIVCNWINKNRYNNQVPVTITRMRKLIWLIVIFIYLICWKTAIMHMLPAGQLEPCDFLMLNLYNYHLHLSHIMDVFIMHHIANKVFLFQIRPVPSPPLSFCSGSLYLYYYWKIRVTSSQSSLWYLWISWFSYFSIVIGLPHK